MPNIQDLWIGDFIRLIKSGREGRYEGLGKSGKIRVKLGEKIILTSIENIEILDPPGPDPINLFDDITEKVEKGKSRREIKMPVFEIDLHIEKLAPEMSNQIASIILNYQIKACCVFIDDTFEQKRYPIKIIHGKGEGVLKAEVQALLKSDSRVKFISDSNQGGATDVWYNL